jgi:peroxiredoxin
MIAAPLTDSKGHPMRRCARSIAGVAIGLGLALATFARGDEALPGPKVGDTAKEFELTSLSGDSVKLSTLTASSPVVLVVLRGYPGYQCPVCTKQYGAFLAKADAFKAAGAQVAFVYPGPADQLKERAKEFVKGKDYPAHFNLLLDPDFKFTNDYGLRWDAKGETAYPSTFVIGKDGKITFAKVSKTHGGRAEVAEVVKALEATK